MELTYIGATWCKTCKVIKPQIEELCKKFSVPFHELDYDNDLEVEEKEQINKVPTVKISSPGSQTTVFNVNQVAQTEAWFAANVKLAATDDF